MQISIFIFFLSWKAAIINYLCLALINIYINFAFIPQNKKKSFLS